MKASDFTRAARKRRQQLGEKAASVAERAGWSEAAIRAMELRGCSPAVDRADRLLKALGVRLVIGDPAGETLEL